MPIFSKDKCYETSSAYVSFITFHLDEHRRRGFNTSQLITFALDPNPAAEKDRNEPPQVITLQFANADVVLLGWKLDLLADRLGENKLSAVGSFPQRYAQLDRSQIVVTDIKITPA